MSFLKPTYLRLISTLLLITCITVGTAAKKNVPTVIRAWQLDKWTGVADTLSGLDSSYLHFPLRSILNDYSISNTTNSNIVSPVQSRLYFDRTRNTDFIFADAYTPYIITPQQVKFYHTTTPYSTIAYKKGFVTNLDQNEINFSFTGNVTRRTNLGMTIDYLNSYGRFANQEGKTVL